MDLAIRQASQRMCYLRDRKDEQELARGTEGKKGPRKRGIWAGLTQNL